MADKNEIDDITRAELRFKSEVDRYAAACTIDGCKHLFENGDAAFYFENDKFVLSFSAMFYQYDGDGNKTEEDFEFTIPVDRVSLYDAWPSKKSQLETAIDFFEKTLSELKSRREFYTVERDGDFFEEWY